MPKPIVRLAYRQDINSASDTPFRKRLFEATWSEFLIQRQSFAKGKDLHTWQDIRETFPKSASALPFKVGFAVAGAIGSLDNRIPDLYDALGYASIPFTGYRFDLIGSDARDRSMHRVSLTFFTGDLTLLEVIGDHLLVSQTPPQTILLPMQKGLSVISYTPSAHTTSCTCLPTALI